MRDEIAHIADGQHGVFSLDDADRLGISRSAVKARVRNGRYERVAPGAYRLVGASPTWRQAVMTAVSAAGAGSAAARSTALILHRLLRSNGPIEVVTPRRRRLRLPPGVVVHTATALPTEDLMDVTGIPTTSIPRSILDFGATSSPDALAGVVDRAIAAELTTASELARFLDRRRRRGRPGVRRLEATLERPHLGAVESRYERIVLEMLLDAGLDPVPQYEIFDDHGRIVARVDLAFPSARVAIEVDGHTYHSTRPQRARDADRQNRLELLGWVVLRFTTDQVYARDPSIVRSVLASLSRPFL